MAEAPGKATPAETVQSCEVHVGVDGTSPSPEELARLFDCKDLQLRKLKVIITLSSDLDALTFDEQEKLGLGWTTIFSKVEESLRTVEKLAVEVVYHQSSTQVTAIRAWDRLRLVDDQLQMQQTLDWDLHKQQPQFLKLEQEEAVQVEELKQCCKSEQKCQQEVDALVRQLEETQEHKRVEAYYQWQQQWKQKMPQPQLPSKSMLALPPNLLSGTARENSNLLPRKQKQEMQERRWQVQEWDLQQQQLQKIGKSMPVLTLMYVRKCTHEMHKQHLLLARPCGDVTVTSPVGPVPSVGGSRSCSTCTAPRPINTTCPESLKHVVCEVCNQLYQILPNLCELSLHGCFWDACLTLFGKDRPLTSLYVQAPNVKVQALHNLGALLPNLTAITVGSQEVTVADEEQLNLYVDALLAIVRHCSNLTSFSIDFPSCILLSQHSWELPQRGQWNSLPSKLQKLDISCMVEGESFNTLTNRVPELCLSFCPHRVKRDVDIAKLLQTLPLLKSLRISALMTFSLYCNSSEFPARFSVLKERLLHRMFHLNIYGLDVWGDSCTEIEAYLTWLPPFPAVRRVRVILLDGYPFDNYLSKLARVFPNVEWLTLIDANNEPENAELRIEFLRPLMACISLQVLNLDALLNLSTDLLMQLFIGMPNLAYLSYRPCKDVDRDKLRAGLQEHGRKVTVVQDCDSAFFNV